MAEWIIGYAAGAYVTNTEIPMTAPGPMRRIVAGFYIHNNTTVAVPLTPHVNNGIDNDVMLYTNHSIKIQIAAGLTNPVILLLVELELEYPSKQYITP